MTEEQPTKAQLPEFEGKVETEEQRAPSFPSWLPSRKVVEGRHCTLVHVWLGLLWIACAGFVVVSLVIYLAIMNPALPVLLGIFVLPLLILQLPVTAKAATFHWTGSPKGFLFATKDTFNCLDCEFKVTAFPNGKAALLFDSDDPAYKLLLVLPTNRRLGIWRALLVQPMIGSHVQILSCHKPQGRRALREALASLTPAERAELDAQLQVDDFGHGVYYRFNGESGRYPSANGEGETISDYLTLEHLAGTATITGFVTTEPDSNHQYRICSGRDLPQARAD